MHLTPRRMTCVRHVFCCNARVPYFTSAVTLYSTLLSVLSRTVRWNWNKESSRLTYIFIYTYIITLYRQLLYHYACSRKSLKARLHQTPIWMIEKRTFRNQKTLLDMCELYRKSVLSHYHTGTHFRIFLQK